MPPKGGGSKGGGKGGGDQKKKKEAPKDTQKVRDLACVPPEAPEEYLVVSRRIGGAKKRAGFDPKIEEKTFGLPNKNKSAKVQRYVKQVEESIKGSSQKARKQEQDKQKAKEAAEQARQEMVPSAIKQPRVPEGIDPKTVVCEFWKHGMCAKGGKCKFAHDFNVQQRRLDEQKKEEEEEDASRLLHKGGPDLYIDYRDYKGKGETMENWNQEDLENAVQAKEGNQKNKPTDKICKYFLEAVETKKYGWFWKCPNGESCKYRHCLPPGYKLKSDVKALAEEEKENDKSLEEDIEERREAIESNTPVTEEVFKQWYNRKKEERERKRREEREERKRQGRLTGREIIELGGTMEDDERAHSREEEAAERQQMDKDAADRQSQSDNEGDEEEEEEEEEGEEQEEEDVNVDDLNRLEHELQEKASVSAPG